MEAVTEFGKGLHCLALIHDARTGKGRDAEVRAGQGVGVCLSCHSPSRGFLGTVLRDVDGASDMSGELIGYWRPAQSLTSCPLPMVP